MLFAKRSRPMRCASLRQGVSCACTSQACLGMLCLNVAVFLNRARMLSTMTDNNLWEFEKVNGSATQKESNPGKCHRTVILTTLIDHCEAERRGSTERGHTAVDQIAASRCDGHPSLLERFPRSRRYPTTADSSARRPAWHQQHTAAAAHTRGRHPDAAAGAAAACAAGGHGKGAAGSEPHS